jgi:hypothetical protein
VAYELSSSFHHQKENDHPPGPILKNHNVVSGEILKKLGGGFWISALLTTKNKLPILSE